MAGDDDADKIKPRRLPREHKIRATWRLWR